MYVLQWWNARFVSMGNKDCRLFLIPAVSANMAWNCQQQTVLKMKKTQLISVVIYIQKSKWHFSAKPRKIHFLRKEPFGQFVGSSGSVGTSPVQVKDLKHKKYWWNIFTWEMVRVHLQKLTWNLEMMVSNRNLLFQGSIFRFHVCFGGCNPYNSEPMCWHFRSLKAGGEVTLGWPMLTPLTFGKLSRVGGCTFFCNQEATGIFSREVEAATRNCLMAHGWQLFPRWWFQSFFFSPLLGEIMIQFDSYFSIGLVQPPTSFSAAHQCYKHYGYGWRKGIQQSSRGYVRRGAIDSLKIAVSVRHQRINNKLELPPTQ